MLWGSRLIWSTKEAPRGSDRHFASSGSEARRLSGPTTHLFTVNPGPPVRRAPAELEFEYARDGLRIRKTFAFPAEGHVVRLETAVAEGGRPQRHLFTWGGGFGDTAQVGNTAHSQTFYYDEGELQYTAVSDAEDERISHAGPFPFVGIADLFFAAAAIPEPGTDIRVETSVVGIVPAGAEVGSERADFVAGAFGGESLNSVRLYVGPKRPRRTRGSPGSRQRVPQHCRFRVFRFHCRASLLHAALDIRKYRCELGLEHSPCHRGDQHRSVSAQVQEH